jgi:plastocyanin
MRRGTMRAALVGVAASALLMVPWSGIGSAGGGCHAGPSQGTGDAVQMVKACFTPSILHVGSGAEVTFTNRDPLVHNVSANGWGQYDDMAQGDAFTVRFEKPGIYPFACNYHPGMTGAIVVGGGIGPGSGEHVSSSASEPPAGTQVQSRPTAEAEGTPVGWIAGGAIGLALGAGLSFLIRRRSSAGR